jgi:uncharacterized protein YkwD
VPREVSLKSPLGVVLIVVVAGAVTWPLVANHSGGPNVRDDPRCPGSGSVPSASGSPAARGEILCLVNAERAAAGLPPLREETHLDAAAQAQSDAMARLHFFAHVDPTGRGSADRIAAAGYPRSAVTGENLAWGSESEATPVRIVASWMDSAEHRANILRRAFSEIGIGVTRGAPRSGVSGQSAIYATSFGAGRLGR